MDDWITALLAGNPMTFPAAAGQTVFKTLGGGGDAAAAPATPDMSPPMPPPRPPSAPALGASLAPADDATVPIGTSGQEPDQMALDTANNTSPSGDQVAQAKKQLDLASVLRGVTVPKPPEPQRVATPQVRSSASAVKGGELMALLNSLGAQGQGLTAGLHLPSTLGQALQAKAYG